jgi:hypothetical protein
MDKVRAVDVSKCCVVFEAATISSTNVNFMGNCCLHLHGIGRYFKALLLSDKPHGVIHHQILILKRQRS